MKWPFRSKYKVYLPFGAINLDNHFGEVVPVASPALAEWLSTCGYSYSLKHKSTTMARWVEFEDKQAATLCKLTFG